MNTRVRHSLAESAFGSVRRHVFDWYLQIKNSPESANSDRDSRAEIRPVELMAGLLLGSRIAELKDPETWAVIQSQSGRLGVRSLLAFKLRGELSGAQKTWCDQVLSENWKRYDRGLQDLQDSVKLLSAAGIESIVLKGPLLAARHYQPPFIRKSSIDIDLAIREADIDRACSVLKAADYVQGKTLSEAKAYGYDLTLLHHSKPRIELHFRLSHGAVGIPVDEFFNRACPFPLANGASAKILSPADEIMHLVLHYSHHRFPLLFNLYEIRQIWQSTPPEVKNEAIQRAIKYRFFGPFLMTDVAFRVIWNERFLPEGEHYPRTWLQGRINERLYWQCVEWSQRLDHLSLANRLHGRWLDFQLTDRPSDSLSFLSMFVNVARFRLRSRGWRTLRYQHHLSEK